MSNNKNAKLNDRKSDGELLLKRFIAFISDWYLASVLAGLPILLMYGMTTGDDKVVTALTSLPFNQAMIAGTLAIVISSAYYVLIPTYVYKGQTLGKRFLGVKVATLDKSEITIKTMFKREILGVLLVEGGIVAGSGYLRQMLGLAISPTLYTVLGGISIIVTVASIVMVYRTIGRRMIHDYIAGTIIIKA